MGAVTWDFTSYGTKVHWADHMCECVYAYMLCGWRMHVHIEYICVHTELGG